MNITKLFYLSPRDIRKNRADPVHIMLSCQAFTNQNIPVELIAPIVKREGYQKNPSIFKLYGIEEDKFRITELNTDITEEGENQTSYFSFVFQILKCITILILQRKEEFKEPSVVIYSKCYISTIPFILFKRLKLINSSIIFEVMTPKNTIPHRFIYKNCDKIVSHIKFASKEIVEMVKIESTKIFEPPFFTQANEILKVTESKCKIRKELGLSEDRFYVLYAGKTGEETLQVDYFIEAAKMVPQLDFLIVGANEIAQNRYKAIIKEKKITNLIVFPFQPLINYYRFVIAADLLVGYYPYTNHNAYNLSPGKAGIYFASKNPCIFSDLPSLRSLFPDNAIFYVKPDSPELLAEKILYVSDNPLEAVKAAQAAFEFAQASTYDNLAGNIANFIEND